jgi:hypothetical protein
MTPIERRLLDELEIQKLAAAYSHAVMRLDGSAAGAVYAEDGVLSAFYYPDIVGRQAVTEALTRTFAPIQFIVQNCGAGIVDIDGDTARATWSVNELLRMREQEALSCCFGSYEDTLVRTEAGWRFKRRRFVPFYRGEIPSNGRLYREPEFENAFGPWPFLGRAIGDA